MPDVCDACVMEIYGICVVRQGNHSEPAHEKSLPPGHTLVSSGSRPIVLPLLLLSAGCAPGVCLAVPQVIQIVRGGLIQVVIQPVAEQQVRGSSKMSAKWPFSCYFVERQPESLASVSRKSAPETPEPRLAGTSR